MKQLKYLAIVATLALLVPLSALAGTANKRSVTINDPITIGGTHLKPGDYRVEWQGTGPAVQVNFVQEGKTIATAPAQLQSNDSQVSQDDVVLDRTNTNAMTLKEIDFVHQKEALVFAESGM